MNLGVFPLRNGQLLDSGTSAWWAMVKAFVRGVAVFALLSGCAADRELTREQGESLLERVNAHWEFLSAFQYEDAWEYTTPAYRAAFPRELYPLKFGMYLDSRLTGARIVAYSPAEQMATVEVAVETRRRKDLGPSAYGDVPVTTKSSEFWKLVGGSWYVIVPN